MISDIISSKLKVYHVIVLFKWFEKYKKKLKELEVVKIMMRTHRTYLKNTNYEEKQMSDFLIEFYLNQEKDNKNNFITLVCIKKF